MLPRDATSDLVRIVRCDEGEVSVAMELSLRFGYGATTPWVTRLKQDTLRAVAGPAMVVLRTPKASYWVVNTLLDRMSNETMLAIAKGLRPIGTVKER